MEAIEYLQQNEKVKKITKAQVTDLKYEIIDNGYLESYDGDDWEGDLAEKGFMINAGIGESIFKSLQLRCDLQIPELLKEIWLNMDGFLSGFCFEDDDGKRDLNFGLMPMEAAFDMKESHRMYEVTGSDKLLQWPLINPERWDGVMEFAYNNPAKVDIENMLENAIFLENFSNNNVYYTMYKLDADDKHSLFLTYENGVHPIDLTLEEYFEAMLEFKGVVWPWPIMFINEENLDSMYINEKNQKIELAKKYAENLELNLDFEKYNL